jgi:hypothetical protein
MSATDDRRWQPLRAFAVACVALSLTACYPHFDWRDVRPDCALSWCGFVASFPDRVSSVTRDIPVGSKRLPLSLSVVSLDGVTFAVGAFELSSPDDVEPARAAFEHKLLDDVGATDARRGQLTLHAADHGDIAATTFDAEGQRDGKAFRAVARFAERNRHLVEIVVVGPAAALSRESGKQAIETFFTSLRLD